MGGNGRRRIPAVLIAVAVLVTACSSGGAATHSSSAAAPATSTTPASPITVPSTTAPPTTAPPTPRSTARTSSTTPRTPASRPAAARTSGAAPPEAAGRRLPLDFTTGSATQVISVVAPSTNSTQATVQAWRKVSGGWRKVGGTVPAWVGSAGLSRHPSEGRSATPIGSFTLTQAFGRDADPGTALPYFRTRPSDWWISESGPLYNTHQRCSTNCDFTQGDPNEHLYYITPEYDYAAVIDYNTPDAPGGVRQGAGSAFFLHVTDGSPTAGCVAIPKGELVRILDWLRPSAHPRILIGIG